MGAQAGTVQQQAASSNKRKTMRVIKTETKLKCNENLNKI